MNKFYRIIVVFIISIFIFIMCNIKSDSYGDFEKIVVFADSSLMEEVKPLLEETFDQFVYTPLEERSFYLDFQPVSMLNTYRMRRNLIFIGLLDAQDQTSQFVQKSLSDEVQQAVRNGQIFQIFQEDIFATDQSVFFLSASELSILKTNIKNNSNEIFKQLEKFHFKKLEKAMFLNGEQEALNKYIEEKYGCKIRIQYDYQLVKENEDKNFLWIRRLVPDRNLFVYRFPADSMKTDSEWLINLRDSLTTEHFEGDSVDKHDTYTIHTKFIGYHALSLVGVWQNHKYYLGGPFKTFAFYHDSSKYIYLIDISVTSPGKRKKPYLDQLEVMAKSFQFLKTQ